ncbi:MAG: hypothetical protein R3215_10420 [Halomonas sp.]|nr:hypothetical protein [Halomonas sp.]
MSLHKVRFDCNGHNAPAYGCSEPGDNSGEYVQAADAMDVIETLAEALESCMRFIEHDMPPGGGPEIIQARKALDNYRRARK